MREEWPRKRQNNTRAARVAGYAKNAKEGSEQKKADRNIMAGKWTAGRWAEFAILSLRSFVLFRGHSIRVDPCSSVVKSFSSPCLPLALNAPNSFRA